MRHATAPTASAHLRDLRQQLRQAVRARCAQQRGERREVRAAGAPGAHVSSQQRQQCLRVRRCQRGRAACQARGVRELLHDSIHALRLPAAAAVDGCQRLLLRHLLLGLLLARHHRIRACASRACCGAGSGAACGRARRQRGAMQLQQDVVQLLPHSHGAVARHPAQQVRRHHQQLRLQARVVAAQHVVARQAAHERRQQGAVGGLLRRRGGVRHAGRHDERVGARGRAGPGVCDGVHQQRQPGRAGHQRAQQPACAGQAPHDAGVVVRHGGDECGQQLRQVRARGGAGQHEACVQQPARARVAGRRTGGGRGRASGTRMWDRADRRPLQLPPSSLITAAACATVAHLAAAQRRVAVHSRRPDSTCGSSCGSSAAAISRAAALGRPW
jgi:hypothetical protein